MNTQDRYGLPLIFLTINDVLVFGGSVLIAYHIRFSEWFTQHVWAPPAGMPPPDAGQYWQLALFAAVIGLLILERFGFYTYREGFDRGFRPTSLFLVIVVSYVFLMAWLFFYVHSSYSHSRLVIIMAMAVTFVFGMVSQTASRRLMKFLTENGIGFARTVLVTGDADVRDIYERLRSAHGSVHQIKGFINSTGKQPADFPHLPVFGSLNKLGESLKNHRVDRVVVFLPEHQTNRAWRILRFCRQQGYDCRFSTELFERISLSVDVTALDGVRSISLGETPLTESGLMFKRMMDIVIASVGMVVASPIMLMFTLLIKLDSEGPVLYKQERLGADGRTFMMYKFRTMHKDAEKNTGPVWARPNDPRCTRVGRVLRRTNLDELPQVLNILRGDMSLVGPRPERAYFVNRFKKSIPQYMRRHMVKSGLTGWAQVNGLRGNTSVEERTKYDIFYVENWSVLFDLKIILRTLVSNKNAY